MPFFERERMRFAYEEFGPSGAPVVVFSHGFLMDGDMFEPNIAELQNEVRCVVWDQRGFGGAVLDACSYCESASARLFTAREGLPRGYRVKNEERLMVLGL